MNAQSIVKNIGKLQLLASNIDPTIIFCSETCATKEILNNEIKINGYELARCDSHSRYTGGSLMYIRQSTQYSILQSKSYDNMIWSVAVEVKEKGINGIYIIIYRSPSTSASKCLQLLNDLCTTTVDISKPCTVIGDFNIDISSKSLYSEKLVQMFTDIGLKQIVDFNTRITSTSRTTIDLCFTNDTTIKCTCLIDEIVSDHETVQLTKCNTSHNDIEIHKNIINWKNYNKIQLHTLLLNVNWTSFYNLNVTQKLEYVCNVIKSKVECLIEHKKIKINTKKISWYTDELKSLKKTKVHLYCKSKISNKKEDFINYKCARNKYNNKIDETRNMYYQNKIKNASYDSRKMWKCLNNIISVKDTHNSTKTVKFEDHVDICDNMLIASKFNKYFVNSVNDIYNSIVTIDSNINVNNFNHLSFKLQHTTLKELTTILNLCKNKSHPNDIITTQVLKDSFDITGFFFVNIINSSFDTQIVPSTWKLSTVIPIPKVKNTKLYTQFRPINMLPIHEKLIEKVVHKQLIKYLNETNCIVDVQSGFRKGHSCETSLNVILASWKDEIDRGNTIIAVFLDFKRAFETICRKRLLAKLKCIGFEDSALKWVENYLTDRYQQTNFNGATSTAYVNPHGVPQGSVLGPLLFIIYINDIVSAVTHCKINLFADDTLLSISSKKIPSAVNKVNSDLSNLLIWLNSNKLKLNVDKTKYMYISTRTNIDKNHIIHINGEKIDSVTQFKYLGVILDEKLCFKNHIDEIVKKMSKNISIMYRANNRLTAKAKITVYNSLFLPYINYCSTILYLCNKTDTHRLQKQQNKIMRMILKCKKDTSIVFMLDKLEWLSVTQIIYCNVFMLIYKLTKNQLPTNLCSNIKYIHQCHDRNLRNKNDIKTKNYTKTITQNNIFYSGIKLYNNIPLHLRNDTQHSFKKQIKIYVKHTFPYT